MIVVQVSDLRLRTALCRAAHPEEDVVTDPELAAEALAVGFPRLLVRVVEHALGTSDYGLPPGTPVLEIDGAMLARWESQRRAYPVPPPRTDFTVECLRGLLEKQATDATWVDRTLGDLSRAAASGLPTALRAFARRVLEFPSRYPDLGPVAERCGVSRGALKARFRRRRLASPYAYLRWLRVIACAHVLSNRSVSVAQAASRLGFTSDGNLCRSMMSLCGQTPTEVRTQKGWNSLLLGFASRHLGGDALAAWRELDDLFLRRVA